MIHALFHPRFIVSAGLLVGLAGCASLGPREAPGSFARVRPIIESNCVHCHGSGRLAHMPAFNDTRELAALTGPGKLIVPGRPDPSRFFQVVTFSDAQPGAMPPTGHAISRAEVEALREWIAGGAPLPEGAPVVFIPRGQGPRSH